MSKKLNAKHFRVVKNSVRNLNAKYPSKSGLPTFVGYWDKETGWFTILLHDYWLYTDQDFKKKAEVYRKVFKSQKFVGIFAYLTASSVNILVQKSLFNQNKVVKIL